MIKYELLVTVWDDEVPTRLKKDDIIAIVEHANCPAGVHVIVESMHVKEILDAPLGQKEKVNA